MNSNDQRNVGFTAQDVQKLVPEAVSGVEGDLEKGETLSIAYTTLIPVLTKAIQEQNEAIQKKNKMTRWLSLLDHTRFEKARIIGARALQISMGAPLYVTEDELREKFSDELVQLYGVDEAKERVVLDPMKIATLEYEQERIPIDVDPHLDEE